MNKSTLRQAQGKIIIIGQGISGTWLSYYLDKANIPFIVIDEARENSSSKVAAGIINPVTGRRVVKTWMIDELLHFSLEAYTLFGKEIGSKVISQKNIIDFFSAPDYKIAFEKRISEGEKYVSEYDEKNIEHFFYHEFGCGMVSPAYTVHLENLLPVWRNRLAENNQLLEEKFELAELKLSDKNVSYKNIEADKIIFCDGADAAANPYFKNLPFALHKGEALIAEIKDLPGDHIYKKGLSLVPLAQPGIFWCGSNYIWEFEDDKPTDTFRKNTEQHLKNWLKLPFTVLDHKAAVRPANVERRPFVGFHPVYKNIGVLNGMGTKGCSLAPYFAKQLADNIVNNKLILPAADIKRFAKILSRN